MRQLIPTIDLHEDRFRIAKEIGDACAEFGFFCISNHDLDLNLLRNLEKLSGEFFAQEHNEKMKIAMSRGGRAWRGFFPVGGELTSGLPDLKEGLYFGTELDAADERVKRGLPLHGANLFPSIPGFRESILAYMEAMTQLGHRLMALVSLSLGLDENYFRAHFSSDPTTLFRVFHYPPTTLENAKEYPWGVGEHTDYGMLTILLQDDCGGLEVKSKNSWLEVPPLQDVFVCNVGDMLDFLTNGRYVSVPHRVKNRSGRSRYSFPFFFDPDFNALMKPLPTGTAKRSVAQCRWDHADLHEFRGTYGAYLLNKVAKVFPDLAESALQK